MLRPTTVSELLSFYSQTRFLKQETVDSYESSVSNFQEFCGGYCLVSELTPQLALKWLHHRRDVEGKAAATVNKDRRCIVALMHFGFERGSLPPLHKRAIPKVPEPKRHPTAWSPEQVGRILANCEVGVPKRQTAWTAATWRALILTVYDSGLRIGCLLSVPKSAYRADYRTLIIPAEFQKDRQETAHRLHAQTAEAIESLSPSSSRLFPWPLKSNRQIWRHYRSILHAAGLPMTRRDCFHRLRRTSYTQVWIALGPAAACLHAGHSRDLSAAYLDRTFLPASNAADALPRP